MNATSDFKVSFARKVLEHRKTVDAWLAEQERSAPPPVFCSIDLRDAGHKIAPVDCNLFPAGFNNLCSEDVEAAPEFINRELHSIQKRLGRKEPRKIIIIPETHWKNKFYVENLAVLADIVRAAGFETEVGWMVPDPNGFFELESQSGRKVMAYNFSVNEGTLRLDKKDFVPDLVLLNNDFSSGKPTILDSLTQPVIPPHSLGWYSRKKSDFFFHYHQIVREFCSLIGIDPFHLSIETEMVGPVDFGEGVGIDQTAAAVTDILGKIRNDNKTYQVETPPTAFIKSNSGTYGMGIMAVTSPDEILAMNRRTKNKMSVGKSRSAIKSVIVQEGVPTGIEEGEPHEPVMYLCGATLIGGFIRSNTERGALANLNARGMLFKKLCIADLRKALNADSDCSDLSLELVYGTVARLAALSAGRECASL